MNARLLLSSIWLTVIVSSGCAPIELSVVVVSASQAIAEAEVAGAHCTPEQLDRLSPVTENLATDPGTELVSTEEERLTGGTGLPMCDAPYEYYSAVELIHKAREEVGYSDYEAAVEYAREARTFAQKARDIAIQRTKERGR